MPPADLPFIAEADQYLRAASGKDGKPSKFSPTIQYNTLGMALEKYLVGFLEVHGRMPNNHTFTDLVEAMDEFQPLPAPLREKLLELERAQFICAFDTPLMEINQGAADGLREAVQEVAAIVKAGLTEAEPEPQA